MKHIAIRTGLAGLASVAAFALVIPSTAAHAERAAQETAALTGPPAGRFPLLALSMIGPNAGWGLIATHGQPVLLTTRDGARTWTRAVLPAVERSWQWSLFTLSANDAWVVQRNQQTNTDRIYATHDRGRQWRLLSSIHDTQSFVNLHFVTRSRGWLLTNGYPATVQMTWHLYATSDGGRHWRLVSNSSVATPHAIPESAYAEFSFSGPQTAWITGMNPVAGSSQYGVTRNGGGYWRFRTLPSAVKGRNYTAILSAPRFLSPSQGVMPVSYAMGQVGAPGLTYTAVFHTGNAGVTWHTSGRPLLRTPQPVICDVAGGAVYALDPSSRGGGTLYVTRNAGRTWETIGQSKALTGVQSIQFVSADTGFGYTQNTAGTTDILGGQGGWTVEWRMYGAKTLAGGIVETTDGGRTWTRATARVVG